MNKQRRKRLNEVKDKLDELMRELEYIMEEEEQAYNNLPDSIQESDRGEQMSDNCDTIYDWIETIGGVCCDIDDMTAEVAQWTSLSA